MPTRGTRIEIDAGAIRDNCEALLRHMNGAGLMGVVKADGYGHGMETAARAALAGGARSLAVATVAEGLSLRGAGIEADILVLGPFDETTAAEAVRAGLILTIYAPETIPWLDRGSVEAQRVARAHLQIETGMRRLGVLPSNVAAILDVVWSARGIALEGAYSHFAETSDEAFVAEQLSRFTFATDPLMQTYPALERHMASSGTALTHPETLLNYARCGIAMYGYPPCETAVPLRAAMRFVTAVAQLQRVPPGESVSYGRTYYTDKETLIATLPVGYGDGYPRCFGNRGFALLGSRRAPVIGRVCMDLCMIDATDVPDVAVGDEVVLLGGQGEEAVSAEDWALWDGTIAYEAVLRPTARVPKVVV